MKRPDSLMGDCLVKIRSGGGGQCEKTRAYQISKNLGRTAYQYRVNFVYTLYFYLPDYTAVFVPEPLRRQSRGTGGRFPLPFEVAGQGWGLPAPFPGALP